MGSLIVTQTDRGSFAMEKKKLFVGRDKNSRSADYGAEMIVSLNGDPAKIFSWGLKNDLPHRREALVKSNNIVGELLKTKRDITVGRGLIAYRRVFEDGKKRMEQVEIPQKAQEFFDRNSIYHYLLASAQNLFMHGQFFPEFVRASGSARDKIFSIRNMKAKHVRLEQQNEDGVTESVYFTKNWIVKRGSKRRTDVEKIPLYNPLLMDSPPRASKFAMHIGEELIDDDYYYHPMWWGGREWIETANNVPIFHNSNLEHGYTIRWHIQYPKDYFKSRTTDVQGKKAIQDAKTEEEQRKSEFIERMNELLAGVENVGRTVYTSYELNRTMQKEFPGVKITPLKADLKDEALLKLFDKSNQANISAQGIHPTLANIQTEGKLSVGAEIRNAFLMYVAIKTPVPRRLLLEPINLIKKMNGWDPDIHFGFQDMEITKLDENPTGSQNVASE